MPSLQDEIDERSREIHTDRYSMSVNEVVAMYQDNELDIHPEFQRIFRWSIEQQSRLIESIFLGIPVPPIFVAQRQNGVWDVIDGVQRLSTVLRFLGVLRTAEGPLDTPSPLTAGDYLTKLSGLVWDREIARTEDDEDSLFDIPEFSLLEMTDAQKRVFKRARLDIQIVQKESDDSAKYDLFQRLNSGTRLSEQEARNCLAVMLDPDFSKWLNNLASRTSYEQTVDISERKEQEAYGTESVLRYLACANTPIAELHRMGDVGEFLTARMRSFISNPEFKRRQQEETFAFVFDEIGNALGSEAFKRYDAARKRFGGKFSISAFEAIAAGLARNVDAWRRLERRERPERIRECAIAVWADEWFQARSGGGKPANRRIPFMVEVGERIFSLNSDA